MTLDDFKNFLYKERQAVDALATTVKTNMASLDNRKLAKEEGIE